MMEFLVVAVFLLIMIAVSVRAGASLRAEQDLPMHWSHAGKVNWSAPRQIALFFTPALAAVCLMLTALGMRLTTPRPGQEGLEVPILLFMGVIFLGAHLLHLSLIRRTLRRDGR